LMVIRAEAYQGTIQRMKAIAALIWQGRQGVTMQIACTACMCGLQIQHLSVIVIAYVCCMHARSGMSHLPRRLGACDLCLDA
jgi:hypothetical protein